MSMVTRRALQSLNKKYCVPCEGGVAAVSRNEAKRYLRGLKNWTLSPDAKSIRSEHRMKDFMAAIKFINRIAKIAEKEGHHPDLRLYGYRRFQVELSTHAIGGLSENDFILAAKIDKLSP